MFACWQRSKTSIDPPDSVRFPRLSANFDVNSGDSEGAPGDSRCEPVEGDRRSVRESDILWPVGGKRSAYEDLLSKCDRD